MNRIMVWVLGLMASLATSLVFANATAFSVSGSVNAQTGAAASRLVRQGDIVRAGDTVTTGPNSSAVLKFEDGQIAALGANSRLLIQAFEYNAPAKTGNIVLNLLNGGMRAITGLIGRNQPQKVTYKAGNYTIGIRGTDVNIATDAGNAVVTVTDGVISFTFAGQTLTIPAGEGVNARTDGTFQQGAIATIMAQLQATPEGRALLNSINGLQGLTAAINQAAAGREGAFAPGPSGNLGTPGPSGPAVPGGSGTASQR